MSLLTSITLPFLRPASCTGCGVTGEPACCTEFAACCDTTNGPLDISGPASVYTLPDGQNLGNSATYANNMPIKNAVYAATLAGDLLWQNSWFDRGAANAGWQYFGSVYGTFTMYPGATFGTSVYDPRRLVHVHVVFLVVA